MENKWKIIPAEQFCSSVRDGTHDSPKPVENGQHLVTSRHITSGRLDLKNAYLISRDDFESINKRSKVDQWDVLLSMIGTVGETVLVKEEPNFAIKNIGLFKSKSETEGKWLYYYLRSPSALQKIREQCRGTTQAYITLGDLREFPIVTPENPEEMHSIVSVLGTLDDKIELNRQMNETLEAMARAIFKSWFVDFDPVRAKAEGRDTGLPKEIADLFPDSFEETELGEVPKGWEIVALEKHFEAVKGVSYKGSGLGDKGVPLHNLNSVYEGGGYKYEGIKYYNGDFAERHIVKPGDLIVTNTEQGHDRLLIGYAAIVPSIFGDKGIASHHIYRMRTRQKSSLKVTYLCYLLNSPQMHDIVSGYANGTTVNMLPIDGVQQPLIVVPPAELVDAFDKIAAKIESRKGEIITENSTLAELRDTLLPKLILGEVRVKGVKLSAEVE